MSSLASIMEDILNPGNLLWRNDNDVFVLSKFKAVGGYENIDISTDMLISMHTQLPNCLRAFLKSLIMSSNNRSWLYGSDVAANLSYLRNAGFTVSDPLERKQYFTEIRGLRYSSDGETVFLIGDPATVYFEEVDGVKYSFIRRNTTDTVAIPKNELEAAAPGWENTYSALRELDIDTATVLTRVFIRNKSASLDDTDLTFY